MFMDKTNKKIVDKSIDILLKMYGLDVEIRKPLRFDYDFDNNENIEYENKGVTYRLLIPKLLASNKMNASMFVPADGYLEDDIVGYIKADDIKNFKIKSLAIMKKDTLGVYYIDDIVPFMSDDIVIYGTIILRPYNGVVEDKEKLINTSIADDYVYIEKDDNVNTLDETQQEDYETSEEVKPEYSYGGFDTFELIED